MSWYSTKRATTVVSNSGPNGGNACIYHQTMVVAWDEYEARLNSGGHRTLTTKTRMNQVSKEYNLGYHVFQKNHDWFVILPGKRGTIPFEDGMKFNVKNS